MELIKCLLLDRVSRARGGFRDVGWGWGMEKCFRITVAAMKHYVS